MNTLIIIVSGIAALVAILLIVGLFTKKQYAIVREVTIERPPQTVFDFIKHLSNQELYSKWVMMDPYAKKETHGKDGTVGFLSAWDSTNKDVGKGEQEITRIKEGERIDLQIRFEKPFKGTSDSFMITESVNGEQTKVRWGFNGGMQYPMNLMLLFINIPELLGKDIQTSLFTLKTVLESRTGSGETTRDKNHFEISHSR
jgi:uncharacterized protein YndB with AHSA1/START domain